MAGRISESLQLPETTGLYSTAPSRPDGAPACSIPECPEAPLSKLLAVSAALPAAMRRPAWSLGDFRLHKKLYKGTHTSIYQATCLHSGLPVALKVYFLARMPDNIVHMLKREIEIHAQLVHKHVAQLYAAFLDSEQRVVLVQEYAARGDLLGLLQRLGGRMQPDQVGDLVVRPFLDALSYLHSKGICHRDIKPENILFTQNWRLLLADFGVSINLHQERAVTRAGTEGYMAPEVERCPLKADPQDNKDNRELAYSTAVDIWAVGVLAYELMVGFPPAFMSEGNATSDCDAPSAEASLASVKFPPHVSPAARSFILSALQPHAIERPTAAALLSHPWLPQAAVAQASRHLAGLDASRALAARHIDACVPPVRKALSSLVSSGLESNDQGAATREVFSVSAC